MPIKPRVRIAAVFVPALLLYLFTVLVCGSSSKTGWPDYPSALELDSLYLDSLVLDSLTAKIESGTFGQISGMVVVFKGKPAYEKYFRGHSADELYEIQSVTKSISSTLIGIAVREGFIDSLNIPILDFFPEYSEYENMSSRKERITLKDVLQMRAGFEWDEWSMAYLSPGNPVRSMMSHTDWIKYVLDLPVTSEPGSIFCYNTGASMLLAGIIKNRTGRTPKEYADEKLFGPLGIENYGWPTYANGLQPTGFGLELHPADMAKIGMLYLNDGVINGDTILTKEWIYDAAYTGEPMTDGGFYGYQWWIMPIEGQLPQEYIPYASGWGIQHIIFIKSLGLAIAITGEDWDQEHWPIKQILYDYIFKAVRNK